MRLRWSFLAACLLISGSHGFAAESSSLVHQAAVPDWVTPADETGLPPLSDVPAGMEYLLVDAQTRVADQAAYNRLTYRITSNTGLQEGSQITLSFDPDYQSLDYHFVRIIRAGQIIDRFDLAALKIIQQEGELDRHLYNGRLTALLILNDVRVGDIVDYAFTRKGFNPIFGEHYIDNFSATWSIPVRHQRYRLLMSGQRTINGQVFGHHELKSLTIPGSSGNEYVWEGRDLTRAVIDDDTPAWYPSYAFQELTEFTSWRQVAEWALPLYDLAGTQTPELAAKAEELTRGETILEKKVLALLDFVQRDIRYLGMELGPGSHRPNLPATVLAQRFGDCKDKARLFCALLQHIGVEARPALVHSYHRGTVAQWLPSPYAFDHVITRVRLDGKDYWLDPTRSYQRGSLQERGESDLSLALVIAPETSDLAAIPHDPVATPNIYKTEHFSILRFDAPAKLEVVTKYFERSADNLRAYLASTSTEDYSRVLLNVYARLYPDITTAAPLKWEEEADRNQITVTESYVIPKIWTLNLATKREEVEFFPLALRGVMQRPDSPRRSAPLALPYPYNFTVETFVQLPQAWPLKRVEETVASAGFKFRVHRESSGSLLSMSYHWEFDHDSVPAAEIAAYNIGLDRVRDLAGITLIHTPGAQADRAPAGFEPNWTLLLLAAATFVAALYGAWRIHRIPLLPEPPVLPGQGPSGLGGWLVLVILGVLIRPLSQFYFFCRNAPVLFSQRQWVNVTTPDLPNYHVLAAPLFALETVGQVLLLVLNFLAVLLLFQKRRQFKPVIIGFFVFVLVYSFLDSLIAEQIPWAVKNTKLFAQAFGVCLVWIPYFLLSKRVKNTFVR
jgi:hypothetical protein